MNSLRQFESADISDQLNRLYALEAGIKCLSGAGHQLVGPALTITTFPGDNLMVHKALDIAKPGDVLVVAAGGASSTNAVFGDTIATKAIHRQIAGFIIDGMVRDLPGIIDCGLPVFARGATPIGPLHRGPGEINFPIACGGVVVNPGDVVVADQSGIIVIPKNYTARLRDSLCKNKRANEIYLRNVKLGDFSNKWVDTILTDTECPIILQGEPD